MAYRNLSSVSCVDATRVVGSIALAVLLLMLTEVASRGPAMIFKAEREHRIVTELIRSRRETDCRYPCQCGADKPACRSGVSLIKDGCACCHICARQQGDLCDTRFKCGEGLYCPNNTFCKAKSALPCRVGNSTLRDGDQWKPNCSQLCSCQDGQFSCSTLCPHELRRPSSRFCLNPQLVSVGSQCCREWVCQGEREPTNVVNASISTRRPPCQTITTSWTPCSVSCGVGISMRSTNDNPECRSDRETRLCMIRPCDLNDTESDTDCKTTKRVHQYMRIEYNNCQSVKQYKPKYCPLCQRHRCCIPDNVEDRDIEMRCGNHTRIWNYMWIKGCSCSSEWCEK